MAATLSIGNIEYDFFNKITIDLKYGFSASTFTFSALFDSESRTHRRLFRPLTYQPVQVVSDLNERLITGTVLSHRFTRSAIQTLSNISGYSRTGVLSDCNISTQNYPLQYTNLTFRELAEQLISPFDMELVVENDNGVANEIIDEITASNTTTVYAFLSQIAAQRNLVLSHTPFGNLLLTRANTASLPVATFDESITGTEYNVDVQGQQIFSDVTALKQADISNDNASQVTLQNPLVSLFRPKIAQQNVGDDVTVEEAARNAISNQLRNIRLTIKTDRWRWLRDGTLETMQPNNIIAVRSPDVFLFGLTRFFVEQVTLNLDHNQESAVLKCVVPQVYDNQNPRQIFQ